MAGSGTPGRGLTPDGQPTQADLAKEAEFWREWNAVAYERARSRGDIPAPDTRRSEAVRRRAETTAAVAARRAGAGDAEFVQIHAAAGRFFQGALRGSWVPDYLSDRGLAAALLATSPWKIGYAPATWTALTGYLRRQGYDPRVMLRSGLVVTGRDGRLHDRFRDRLMIPLRDERGIAIAFIGRRHPHGTDDDGPKYLNSPDTDVFVKGKVLAGMAEGRLFLARGAQPVLVEGPLDAIAVSIAAPGQFTGIAPCGTSFKPDQAVALSRTVDLPVLGIRVCLDGDTAGRSAAVRTYPVLQPVAGDITAVILPAGQDPADILRQHGQDALRDTLATSICPLADLVVDARIAEQTHGRELTYTEDQIRAVRAATKVIATLSPSDVGLQVQRLCAMFARYDWSPREITREVISAIEDRYESGLPAATIDLLSAATAPAPETPVPRRSSQPASPQRARPGQQRNETERGWQGGPAP
jgi:DNA primase